MIQNLQNLALGASRCDFVPDPKTLTRLGDSDQKRRWHAWYNIVRPNTNHGQFWCSWMRWSMEVLQGWCLMSSRGSSGRYKDVRAEGWWVCFSGQHGTGKFHQSLFLISPEHGWNENLHKQQEGNDMQWFWKCITVIVFATYESLWLIYHAMQGTLLA